MVVDAISVNENERTERNIQRVEKGEGWWEGRPESLQGNQEEIVTRRKRGAFERERPDQVFLPHQINPNEVLSRNEQGLSLL